MSIGDINKRESYIDKTVCQQAVRHYGYNHQLRKAQEECGELITAINKWIDGEIGLLLLASEVADVEIMCEQIRIIIGNKFIDTEIAFKKNRLNETIIKSKKTEDK